MRHYILWFTTLAQSAEQALRKRQVSSSILEGGFMQSVVARRARHTTYCGFGSNPERLVFLRFNTLFQYPRTGRPNGERWPTPFSR
jgi:hypothetical protein